MDAVAAAAGVGKGTVFRRFGDRAGLMRSLLDEHETAFQEGVIRGEPPLGPGAPPIERLAAFGRARFDLLERHGLMIAAAEASERGDARFDSPVYVFYRSHIAMLVREARPDCDADYVTEALLAPAGSDRVRLPAPRARDVTRARRRRLRVARPPAARLAAPAKRGVQGRGTEGGLARRPADQESALCRAVRTAGSRRRRSR